jgi:hypothetical protein
VWLRNSSHDRITRERKLHAYGAFGSGNCEYDKICGRVPMGEKQ